MKIIEHNENLSNLVIIGIKTHGVPLADRIQKFIEDFENIKVPTDYLDTSDFRDDLLEKNHIAPKFNFDIKNKDIILVDDVLYTGRTVRAGIEAIMEAGRPNSIQLAVLVDRRHRQLPFRADYVGKNIPTSHQEQIELKLEEIDGIDVVYLLG